MTDPRVSRLRLSVPAVSARVSLELVASTLARLIASNIAVTRADLVRSPGWPAPPSPPDWTCWKRRHPEPGHPPDHRPGPAGRRPRAEPSFGLILVADDGIHFARLTVHDLSQGIGALSAGLGRRDY